MDLTDAPSTRRALVSIDVLDVGAIDDRLRADLDRSLSSGEREHAAMLRFEEDSLSYRAAHGLARIALGRRASVDPASLSFGRDPLGKPFVLGPGGARAISFNLSHTRRFVAVISGIGVDVGVDVETVTSSCEVGALSSRFFAPEEVVDLGRFTGAAMVRRFFALWTLKEAYVKARGVGLSVPLDTFSFELDADDRPRRLHDRHRSDADVCRWRFGLAPISDHLLAWAIDAHHHEVCVEVCHFGGGNHAL